MLILVLFQEYIEDHYLCLLITLYTHYFSDVLFYIVHNPLSIPHLNHSSPANLHHCKLGTGLTSRSPLVHFSTSLLQGPSPFSYIVPGPSFHSIVIPTSLHEFVLSSPSPVSSIPGSIHQTRLRIYIIFDNLTKVIPYLTRQNFMTVSTIHL